MRCSSGKIETHCATGTSKWPEPSEVRAGGILRYENTPLRVVLARDLKTEWLNGWTLWIVLLCSFFYSCVARKVLRLLTPIIVMALWSLTAYEFSCLYCYTGSMFWCLLSRSCTWEKRRTVQNQKVCHISFIDWVQDWVKFKFIFALLTSSSQMLVLLYFLVMT